MTKHRVEIGVLGQRIGQVDKMIVQALAARHRLVLQVGETKAENSAPIYRSEVEKQRLAAAAEYGKLFGLDADYVRAIMHSVIREACMDQLIQRETPPQASYEDLKANLLELTRLIAPNYDRTYLQHIASQLYVAYEDARLEDLILEVPRERRGKFLDLGCGTGNISFRAAYLFDSVVGFDLSPDMLAVASEKWKERHSNTKVQFKEIDLEDCIPEETGSASFVAMTFGTGSDLQNFTHVIEETMRVLEKGGRFLFSFYNANALLYQWQYVPWQVGLAARVNLDEHCLDVEEAGRIFRIYAQPYSTDSVREMFQGVGVDSLAVVTYPTISSVLPSEAFVGQPVERLIETVTGLDRQLSFGHHGAYIIVTGTKK